ALLDAALHAATLLNGAGDQAPDDRAGDGPEVRLPFAWSGVRLQAAGASLLRVRVQAGTTGGLSLVAADGAGMPVVSVGQLITRPVPVGGLTAAGPGARVPDALFTEEWVPLTAETAAGTPDGTNGRRWVVLGPGEPGLAAELAAAGVAVSRFPDVAGLTAAVTAGELVPEVVVAEVAGAGPGRGDAAGGGVAEVVAGGLGLVQEWLAADGLGGARLVVVTRGAVAAGLGDEVTDVVVAGVRGLVRSAQAEHPGRLVLADLPAAGGLDAAAVVALARVVAGGDEPEVAVRAGRVLARRLARPQLGLSIPDGEGWWRLEPASSGSLDELAAVPDPGAGPGPLGAGQVRVAVRAAGVNFRDVLIALGVYPGDAVMGSEIAGVITGTGPGVTGLVPGDRVLGLASGGFGPVTVTDARLVVPVPAGWSFAQAAAVPVAYATAWYALHDLARITAADTVVIHAAAGGVGMAACALAALAGARVLATASPGKQALVASRGVPADGIASSRDTGFRQVFLDATGGAG
ncbi:MAG TPA: alcohol dehydrogenase catalytic domain-containing protein, partial [Streptosporangiaceae bacterium]